MSDEELAVYELWADATPGESRVRILELVAEVRRLRQQVDERNTAYEIMRELKNAVAEELQQAKADLHKLAGKTLAWATEPPTVPGWHKWRPSNPESDVLVTEGQIAAGKLREIGGEWAGPLVAPPA